MLVIAAAVEKWAAANVRGAQTLRAQQICATNCRSR
jgi:hypothetical protein